jgi:hypothetical protein
MGRLEHLHNQAQAPVPTVLRSAYRTIRACQLQHAGIFGARRRLPSLEKRSAVDPSAMQS